MNAEQGLEVADPLTAGREALRRGEWERAREYFEAAHERGESAEAMEALAMAVWWLDDGQLTIESRERAYRLYRERGHAAGAARMATWLGWDYLAFRGEPAVARGWLQRAHRLLAALDPVPEHGWLAIREGEFAFVLENDLAGTRRWAERARAIGSSLGVDDIELSALGLEGLALASEGNISDGIRQLDEASAAAIAGEISELWAVGRTCCYMITACERVRDFDRASQWCQRMLEFAERWRIRDLFAVCRAHYGAILVSRGTWEEADATFETAMQEFAGSRPGMAFEAVVRRAELRRRQGRLEEAADLFYKVEFHPYAQLGLAHVALDGGDAAGAAERAERFLSKLGPESRLQRAAGLELYARSLVALAEVERARSGDRATRSPGGGGYRLASCLGAGSRGCRRGGRRRPRCRAPKHGGRHRSLSADRRSVRNGTVAARPGAGARCARAHRRSGPAGAPRSGGSAGNAGGARCATRR